MGNPKQSARRPSQLSPLAKGVVIALVAASFITGFMTSEMMEGREDEEGSLDDFQAKVHGGDPELLNVLGVESGDTNPTQPTSTPLNWRGLHGLTSPFLAVMFGWLMFQHAQAGWRMRANLWTGLPIAVVFGGLILTGAFILYPEMLFGLVDPQSESNWLKELHDLLGWLFLVGFLGHLIGAKVFKKKIKKPVDTENQSQ
tara:strand:- start:2612 stop:3211 length:600 start_codon:yes stop_codon:yes gene_type:complete